MWRNRALLPSTCSILYGSFGVGTDKQVDIVRRNVTKLAGAKKTNVHVLKETILNVTRKQVSENRDSIILDALNLEVTQFESNINKEITKFTQFVQTYLQLSKSRFKV